MKTFRLALALFALLSAVSAHAQSAPSLAAYQNFCSTGGVAVKTQGVSSSNTVQASYPRCTVSVYLTGTQTLATIYRDANQTALGNPFTANADGSFLLFAATGVGYDIVLSGGSPTSFPQPFTLTDVLLGGGGGGGGGGGTNPTTNGIQKWSTTAKAWSAGLPADVLALVAQLPNCNVAGDAFFPGAGQCNPAPSGGGTTISGAPYTAAMFDSTGKQVANSNLVQNATTGAMSFAKAVFGAHNTLDGPNGERSANCLFGAPGEAAYCDARAFTSDISGYYNNPGNQAGLYGFSDYYASHGSAIRGAVHREMYFYGKRGDVNGTDITFTATGECANAADECVHDHRDQQFEMVPAAGTVSAVPGGVGPGVQLYNNAPSVQPAPSITVANPGTSLSLFTATVGSFAAAGNGITNGVQGDTGAYINTATASDNWNVCTQVTNVGSTGIGPGLLTAGGQGVKLDVTTNAITVYRFNNGGINADQSFNIPTASSGTACMVFYRGGMGIFWNGALVGATTDTTVTSGLYPAVFAYQQGPQITSVTAGPANPANIPAFGIDRANGQVVAVNPNNIGYGNFAVTEMQALHGAATISWNEALVDCEFGSPAQQYNVCGPNGVGTSYYDANGVFVGSQNTNSSTSYSYYDDPFYPPPGAVFFRSTYDSRFNAATAMIVSGPTVPSTYQPYNPNAFPAAPAGSDGFLTFSTALNTLGSGGPIIDLNTEQDVTVAAVTGSGGGVVTTVLPASVSGTLAAGISIAQGTQDEDGQVTTFNVNASTAPAGNCFISGSSVPEPYVPMSVSTVSNGVYAVTAKLRQNHNANDKNSCGGWAGRLRQVEVGTGANFQSPLPRLEGGTPNRHLTWISDTISGSILAVDQVSPGSGMTPGTYTINASGGGGTGAQITATVSATALTGYTIVSPGSGYTSQPTLSLAAAGGTPAILRADISAFNTAYANFGSTGTGYVLPGTDAVFQGAMVYDVRNPNNGMHADGLAAMVNASSTPWRSGDAIEQPNALNVTWNLDHTLQQFHHPYARYVIHDEGEIGGGIPITGQYWMTAYDAGSHLTMMYWSQGWGSGIATDGVPTGGPVLNPCSMVAFYLCTGLMAPTDSPFFIWGGQFENSPGSDVSTGFGGIQVIPGTHRLKFIGSDFVNPMTITTDAQAACAAGSCGAYSIAEDFEGPTPGFTGTKYTDGGRFEGRDGYTRISPAVSGLDPTNASDGNPITAQINTSFVKQLHGGGYTISCNDGDAQHCFVLDINGNVTLGTGSLIVGDTANDGHHWKITVSPTGVVGAAQVN